ncbi:MAG: hypothetical protein E7047_06780 [Lentisphaerae bacterium]|nr:hypothetical protein [Lentisphaerota bacterium]
MIKCRKNYANLLLLSVLLFVISVPVQPVADSGNSAVSWQTSAGERSFQWENQSGALIYRGQQLTATVVDEFTCLAPEPLEIKLVKSIEQYEKRPEAVNSGQPEKWTSGSRAPPCSC